MTIQFQYRNQDFLQTALLYTENLISQAMRMVSNATKGGQIFAYWHEQRKTIFPLYLAIEPTSHEEDATARKIGCTVTLFHSVPLSPSRWRATKVFFPSLLFSRGSSIVCWKTDKVCSHRWRTRTLTNSDYFFTLILLNEISQLKFFSYYKGKMYSVIKKPPRRRAQMISILKSRPTPPGDDVRRGYACRREVRKAK